MNHLQQLLLQHIVYPNFHHILCRLHLICNVIKRVSCSLIVKEAIWNYTTVLLSDVHSTHRKDNKHLYALQFFVLYKLSFVYWSIRLNVLPIYEIICCWRNTSCQTLLVRLRQCFNKTIRTSLGQLIKSWSFTSPIGKPLCSVLYSVCFFGMDIGWKCEFRNTQLIVATEQISVGSGKQVVFKKKLHLLPVIYWSVTCAFLWQKS